MAPIRALLIEADERLGALVSAYLGERGVGVVRARDGDAGLAAEAREPFDVVVLDVMLPGDDGFEVCRALRRRTAVPMIVLTARTEEGDRVRGLELGADVCLVKPISMRELLARLKALVRRASGRVGPNAEVVHAGRVVVDPGAMLATLDGQPVELTPNEFQLLRVLAQRRGEVLSREQLLELTDGTSDDVFDRSIDIRISRLRGKLGDDPRRPTLICTIRGVGYMLATQPGA